MVSKDENQKASKGLVIFEDEVVANFNPLALLRPVYFLRPGIRNLSERIIDDFENYQPHLFCRPEIAAITAEQTKIPVNRFTLDDPVEIIFVNGRVAWSTEFGEALKKADGNVILTSGTTILAFKMIGPLADQEKHLLQSGELGGLFVGLAAKSEEIQLEIPTYNYLWDIVNGIGDEITDDFDFYKKKFPAEGFLSESNPEDIENAVARGISFINADQIYIASDAVLYPGIVLDATDGPIFIGSEVKIEPFSYIAGPTYIGRKTHVVGGKITECSLGPECRVGGEVEKTIIQGYSNKYHAGFLGHAYLGEWINLGAMTTNSDLKNNYKPVEVSVNGQLLNTGSLKVGSFIGDFTKTAIGTLLNTGINIGVSCNIISEGIVTDKEIPSFTWYSPRHKRNYNLAKALETIERTTVRREVELSTAWKDRLTEISRSAACGTAG